MVLAAKDFKVRYKRATFGVLWAVALPLLQSAVMIVVFSRVGRFSAEGFDYAGYVLAGMVGWGYVASTVPSAATAIVDAASLTDKVWFPRALLVLSPVLANLIGLGITASLVAGIALFREGLDLGVLLLLPAAALLVALISGLCLVAAALHVVFRDIRFIVQAGLLVLFYATPVLYPIRLLEDLETAASVVNPLVGVVGLFQAALTDAPVRATALMASTVWAAALLLVAVRLHHRRDRLFVDLL
ncbi:MAG: ABC transporter permease [Acidimicrobiales bacterium]